MFQRTFKAFRYRDFRVMFFGSCTSSVGTFMQIVAQSWLVFYLSKSSFFLGLDSFLGQIPIFMFSLVGGAVADRIERRYLLLGSQYIQMTCAFTLAVVYALGYIQVWQILSLSFVVGLAQSFGGPAYSALIPSLVKSEDLPNAIALNSIQFNLARVIGPMLGGIALKQLNATWCFGLNGLSFVAVIISLYMVQTRFMPKPTGDSLMTSVKQGIHFIRGREGMVGLIALAFLMTMLCFPLIVFLPVFAKDVFHAGPGVFTILLCSSGAGSVLGALAVATMDKLKNRGRIALLLLVVLGVLMLGFSLSKDLRLSAFLLFLSGGVLMGVFASISSLVQLITPNDMRGRVMSVYNVAFRGGMPFGSLAVGLLSVRFSAPAVLAVNGVLLSLLGLWFLLVQRRVAAL
ncbi:MAG: MFS transporter [Bryobacteraceae bacterium]